MFNAFDVKFKSATSSSKLKYAHFRTFHFRTKVVCYITRYMCIALAFINMSSFQCYIMFALLILSALQWIYFFILLRKKQICPYRSECWVDLNDSSMKSCFLTYSNGKIQNTISLTFFIKQFTPSWKKSK